MIKGIDTETNKNESGFGRCIEHRTKAEGTANDDQDKRSKDDKPPHEEKVTGCYCCGEQYEE